jgi:hypothetical protein
MTADQKPCTDGDPAISMGSFSLDPEVLAKQSFRMWLTTLDSNYAAFMSLESPQPAEQWGSNSPNLGAAGGAT